jgi:hypothetical protein
LKRPGSLFNLLLAGIMLCLLPHASAQKECLDEAIAAFKKMDTKTDSGLVGKNIFFSYTVKVINWDDETTTSNVKIYRKDGLLNMQSEQAQIYQDNKEVLIILPAQQLVILNETNTKLNNLKRTGQFYEARYDFLNSCVVERCEANGDTKTIYAKPGQGGTDETLKIAYVTCTYNTKRQSIVSVKIDYKPEYKIKQLTTTYTDFKVVDSYQFLPARSFYFNNKGKALEKYKSYTFQDNRKK